MICEIIIVLYIAEDWSFCVCFHIGVLFNSVESNETLLKKHNLNTVSLSFFNNG